MQNMSGLSSSKSEITLMRIPEILKIMPVSKSKFWLMIQKGEFPKPIKIGRSSFWTLEQVQGYLRGKVGELNNGL